MAEIGGPRHYEGPTLGPLTLWKCPACGADNQSPLEEGCPACGSGAQKAKHVGVPPVRRPMLEPLPPRVDSPYGDAAFTQWVQPYAGEVGGTRMAVLLREAWMAAIDWYRGQQEIPPTEELPPVQVRIVPRALLAKVIETLEATTDLPDGQSEDLLSLIAQLKEIYE